MLHLFHLLVGLLLPACGAEGAAGLPKPPPLEVARLERPATPNTALAAPEGFGPTPDLVTRRYEVPPDRLYAAIKAVAAGQPRVFVQAEYPERRQVHYVARSLVFNFPDLVTADVGADGRLVLWSRSVYGKSDLGVNKKRLQTWLAALDAELARGAGS